MVRGDCLLDLLDETGIASCQRGAGRKRQANNYGCVRAYDSTGLWIGRSNA
jgi:hypothetical protein